MKNSEIIEMTTAELIERVETEKAALNKMVLWQPSTWQLVR